MPPNPVRSQDSVTYVITDQWGRQLHPGHKDTTGLLQKLMSFRYQKPNQILIEGTVSNPEFEPNQISATLNQSRMRTGQASIIEKVIKMSKYWRKTSMNNVYIIVRSI